MVVSAALAQVDHKGGFRTDPRPSTMPRAAGATVKVGVRVVRAGLLGFRHRLVQCLLCGGNELRRPAQRA